MNYSILFKNKDFNEHPTMVQSGIISDVQKEDFLQTTDEVDYSRLLCSYNELPSLCKVEITEKTALQLAASGYVCNHNGVFTVTIKDSKWMRRFVSFTWEELPSGLYECKYVYRKEIMLYNWINYHFEEIGMPDRVEAILAYTLGLLKTQ